MSRHDGRDWQRSEGRGIEYREHLTRRHGNGFDRYYRIRFTIQGKPMAKALGWASDGWTLENVKAERARIVNAMRSKTLLREFPPTSADACEQSLVAAVERVADTAAVLQQSIDGLSLLLTRITERS